MRAGKFIFAIIALLLFGVGCEEKTLTTDAIIIKELPKMYLLDGKMKQGEGKVVQSRQELLALFSQDEIDKYPDLKGIDFSTQTLLIGCDGLPSLAHLNYAFYKNKDDDFIFFVVIGGDATQPDPHFHYGIVVEKLAKTAKVIFNVVKI